MDYIFMTEAQRKQQRKAVHRKMKINDTLALIFGIAGVVFAAIENELYYGQDSKWETTCYKGDKEISCSAFNDCDEKDDCDWEWKPKNPEDKYKETTTCTLLRVIQGITSLILVGFIFNHYRIRLMHLKAKQKLDSYDTLRSSGLIFPMIIECIYCIIHNPPQINATFDWEQNGGKIAKYSLDDFIFILMLGRIYLLWRLFANYSNWNDETANEICNQCLCEGGVNFAIKAELKERPYFIVTVVLTISIVIFGIGLKVAERTYKEESKKDWDQLLNSMWCIIITMATVGYGDFYPSTDLGRIIGVMGCFWGTFLVSLMVVSLTISSEFTPQERKAYDRITRDEATKLTAHKAADAIKFAVKVRVFLRKNPYASDRQKAAHINKFKSAIIAYRNHKRNMVASEQDAPIEYILAKLNDKVSFGLDRVKNDCRTYRNLLQRLDKTENNQNSMEEDLQQLQEITDQTILQLTALKQRFVKNAKGRQT